MLNVELVSDAEVCKLLILVEDALVVIVLLELIYVAVRSVWDRRLPAMHRSMACLVLRRRIHACLPRILVCPLSNHLLQALFHILQSHGYSALTHCSSIDLSRLWQLKVSAILPPHISSANLTMNLVVLLLVVVSGQDKEVLASYVAVV